MQPYNQIVDYLTQVANLPRSAALALALSANTIQQSGIPFILPSSGTVGANGALSGLTALPTTYANAYMYFPAGAVFAGSAAGMYFVKMSSTTAGTIYNNQPASGDPQVVAGTPIVAAGPGAYTQTAGSYVNMISTPILAQWLSNDGQFRGTFSLACNNTVGNKLLQAALSGTALWSTTLASVASQETGWHTVNRGVLNSQVSTPVGGNIVGAGVATGYTYTAVDTSVQTTLQINAQLATATDYLVIERHVIELMPEN